MEMVRQGEYRLIRVDGTETLISERPTVAKILIAIGAECVDTVRIDWKNDQIMVVDDSGMIDGKPVNEKATLFYRRVCRPGSKGAIHGDVAIVNDRDFGEDETDDSCTT